MSISNLCVSKTSLMAKIVFGYLNNHDAIWVDILYNKYGNVNFWIDSIPANYSWFFRGMWYIANVIKPHIWLNHVNSAQTNFMFNPWYFEVSLAFKPTYLNMNMNLNKLQIPDIMVGSSWNIHLMPDIFGVILNSEFLNLGTDSGDHGNR